MSELTGGRSGVKNKQKKAKKRAKRAMLDDLTKVVRGHQMPSDIGLFFGRNASDVVSPLGGRRTLGGRA